MRVLEYVKGCGDQTTVLVTGFTNSAMCGVGTPKMGDEVVVFVCLKSQDRKIWGLNTYSLFTGMYVISSDMGGEEAKRRAKLGELRNRVREKYGCCSCCRSFMAKCGKRDNNNNNNNNNNGNGGGGVLPPSTGGNHVPDVPAVPVLPSDPDNGFSSIGVVQAPGVPIAPMAPGIPGVPGVPGVPGIPAFPMSPSAPSLPKIPDLNGFDSKMKNILGNTFGGSF